MPATDRTSRPRNPLDLVQRIDGRDTRNEHVQRCSDLRSVTGSHPHPREDRPITTDDHPTPEPDHDPKTENPTTTPLYADLDHCPCGAVATDGPLCGKCRARATWQRRQAERSRHTPRRPNERHRPAGRDRDTDRPRGRRSGR